MSRVDLLSDSYAKIDWAGKRLGELKVEVSRFVNSRPYDLTDDHDPNTGDYLIRVKPHTPAPEIALMVSDVLCSLRPALDYLIYALTILDSGQPHDETQFPICSSPQNFAGQQSRIQWLSKLHQTAIENLQPYPGRQDVEWLAVLRSLSNPDKHRHLHTAAGLIEGEFRIVGPARSPFAGRSSGIYATSYIGGLPGPIREAQFPQDAGREVDMKLGITVGVAFTDGTPVVETLEILQTQVRQLIDAFKPDF